MIRLLARSIREFKAKAILSPLCMVGEVAMEVLIPALMAGLIDKGIKTADMGYVVQRGMDALMQGRTTFVIAHRLSTVMNSDCIMVLDHGRIIERGTHADLIAQKGTYYRLYTGAFELE